MRYVASTIPYRVAIYHAGAGKVVIPRMNFGMLLFMMESTVGDAIRKSGGEMEAIITKP